MGRGLSKGRTICLNAARRGQSARARLVPGRRVGQVDRTFTTNRPSARTTCPRTRAGPAPRQCPTPASILARLL